MLVTAALLELLQLKFEKCSFVVNFFRKNWIRITPECHPISSFIYKTKVILIKLQIGLQNQNWRLRICPLIAELCNAVSLAWHLEPDFKYTKWRGRATTQAAGVDHVDVANLSLWTEATNGRFDHPPDDIWEWGATVEWHWKGKA
jgi:hypothetical protein